MKRIFLIALAVLTTSVWTTSAPAAVIAFGNRTDFNAAIAGFGTIHFEDFDSTASGTNIANGTTLNDISYSYTSNFAGNTMQVTNTALALTNPNTLGVFYTGLGFTSGFDPNDDVTLTFAEPVTAFGAWFSTGALPDGSNRVTTSNGDSVLSGYDPNISGGFGQFAGLISDTPFTSVTIEGIAFFGYTIDNITAAVPEPGTFVLAGLAACSLGAVMLRRRLE